MDNDIQRVIYPIGRFMAVKDMDKTDKQYEIDFLKLNSKVIPPLPHYFLEFF